MYNAGGWAVVTKETEQPKGGIVSYDRGVDV